MDDAQEQKLRDRIHELADKLNTALTRLEVVSVRMENATDHLDRIDEAMVKVIEHVDDHSGRLVAIETRDADARATGSRWGAAGGGLAAVLLWGLQHLFGGSAK